MKRAVLGYGLVRKFTADGVFHAWHLAQVQPRIRIWIGWVSISNKIGYDCARDSCRIPSFGLERDVGNLLALLRNLARRLYLPVGVQGELVGSTDPLSRALRNQVCAAEHGYDQNLEIAPAA